VNLLGPLELGQPLLELLRSQCREPRRQLLGSHLDEERARQLESQTHSIQSKYDTYIKNTAIESAHPNLRSLRGHTSAVADHLKREIQERLSKAGVEVIEARISHLAYAPEIAEAMLRRQQATAVVAARFQIVEGAVSMVELALQKLSEKNVVVLDEERKAAMVSNLLVVLCSESSASPVINAGTLYH
jgi:hypothetical protein